MKNASMNGASGSGCVAVGPPAMISGPPSPRSALRSGMPLRSRTFSTFVYVSSYCSENPTTSNSASGAADSSVSIGRPRARSSASQSSQGENARSQAMSSARLSTPYRIFVPRCDIPISYTSGNTRQTRAATLAAGLRTCWYSPPT